MEAVIQERRQFNVFEVNLKSMQRITCYTSYKNDFFFQILVVFAMSLFQKENRDTHSLMENKVHFTARKNNNLRHEQFWS